MHIERVHRVRRTMFKCQRDLGRERTGEGREKGKGKGEEKEIGDGKWEGERVKGGKKDKNAKGRGGEERREGKVGKR